MSGYCNNLIEVPFHSISNLFQSKPSTMYQVLWHPEEYRDSSVINLQIFFACR
jgi:hypothetical protein